VLSAAPKTAINETLNCYQQHQRLLSTAPITAISGTKDCYH
jgi:hypothetical protein